jgi:hypothetical protein
MDIIQITAQQRQSEIKARQSGYTAFPIYVVYETINRYVERDTDYSLGTSVFRDDDDFVRVSDDGHEIEAGDGDWDDYTTINDTVYNPVVRKVYHDKFKTVCFTRAAAEEYMQRDRHNLTNPRIYVHSINSDNAEMRKFANLLGDKQ